MYRNALQVHVRTVWVQVHLVSFWGSGLPDFFLGSLFSGSLVLCKVPPPPKPPSSQLETQIFQKFLGGQRGRKFATAHLFGKGRHTLRPLPMTMMGLEM